MDELSEMGEFVELHWLVELYVLVEFNELGTLDELDELDGLDKFGEFCELVILHEVGQLGKVFFRTMGRWGSKVLNFLVKKTHSVIFTANIQNCPETYIT